MGLLALSMILNCVLVVGVYLLDKYTRLKEWSYIQKQIIIKRYFKGHTQEEIASELFISQAQVSRLEKAAILSLKKLF